MVKKISTSQITQKNNKYNNHTYNNRYNNRYKLQLDLDGKIIKYKSNLNENYKNFLETFYVNQEIAITPIQLYSAWSGVHMNTIKNFIKTAFSRGWIYKLIPQEGAHISSAYIDFKQPDFIKETNQTINDKRNSYYKISKIGIKLFENEMSCM